jgi:hypothetical protein
MSELIGDTIFRLQESCFWYLRTVDRVECLDHVGRDFTDRKQGLKSAYSI